MIEKSSLNQGSQEKGKLGMRHREEKEKEGEAQEGVHETRQTSTSVQEECPGSNRTPEEVWIGPEGQTPKGTLNINPSPLHGTLEVIKGWNPDKNQTPYQNSVLEVVSKASPVQDQSITPKVKPAKTGNQEKQTKRELGARKNWEYPKQETKTHLDTKKN